MDDGLFVAIKVVNLEKVEKEAVDSIMVRLFPPRLVPFFAILSLSVSRPKNFIIVFELLLS